VSRTPWVKLVGAALRAPSLSGDAYLGVRCGLSAAAQRRVLLVSVTLLGAALLATVLLGLLGVVLWMLSEAGR